MAPEREQPGPRPSSALRAVPTYAPERPGAPVDLHLDVNEGPPPPAELVTEPLHDVEAVRRYPDPSALEATLAARLGLPASRVLATAGANDAILRVCRSFLEPGRRMVLPEPTFAMIRRYAALTGADVTSIPWTDGPYPAEAVLEAADASTAVLVVVSPNNPTGLTARRAEVERLARSRPDAAVLLDHAYVELADEDLTGLVEELPNLVVTRTLSKAWGLAGLRVGYAVARPELVELLRNAAPPFVVPGPSEAIARARLADEASMRQLVDRVRHERAELRRLVEGYGIATTASEANFVLGRFGDGAWIRDALAGFGIGVRAFVGEDAALEGAVRITLPGEASRFERLRHALRTVLEPEALLVDRAGVEPETLARLARMSAASVRPVEDAETAEALSETVRALGVERAWVITPRAEVARAAREARVLPVGLTGHGSTADALIEAGAGRAVADAAELEERLP